MRGGTTAASPRPFQAIVGVLATKIEWERGGRYNNDLHATREPDGATVKAR